MEDKQLCSSCLQGEVVKGSACVRDYISKGPAIIRTIQSAPKVLTPTPVADVTSVFIYLLIYLFVCLFIYLCKTATLDRNMYSIREEIKRTVT
jgi:hypothetical protein